MLWLCFKLPSCLLDNTRDTSSMHEKAKFVCFIYMQPQKVKFKSVQMTMKHVSYVKKVMKLLAFIFEQPSYVIISYDQVFQVTYM